ncbi:MAG: tRNA glutamyl-Q(34) synthetase GluQRS [Gammaproteobacteria bacterium]|nr:tRNA glutamyl-Q(34) synthetase GluQRS [Gammaproteobacteria bacterium]
MQQPERYRGRFAPSPSGPLHAGSLVAALGSYLDARAHQGEWLVRIDDIDPPREIPGAADTILKQLEAHGLKWDGSVMWQSQQSERYAAALSALTNAQLCYYCHCTRAQIKARGAYYDGHCRHLKLSSEGTAVRLMNHSPISHFHDRFHGHVNSDPQQAAEDFLLRRRDQLWAYQLAVVCDDRAAGITDIVRGEDLLHASAWQLTLWQVFNDIRLNDTQVPLPRLAHLPLVVDANGRKLSKQNHAPALSLQTPLANLRRAAQALGLPGAASEKATNIEEYLAWAIDAWRQHKK